MHPKQLCLHTAYELHAAVPLHPLLAVPRITKGRPRRPSRLEVAVTTSLPRQWFTMSHEDLARYSALVGPAVKRAEANISNLTDWCVQSTALRAHLMFSMVASSDPVRSQVLLLSRAGAVHCTRSRPMHQLSILGLVFRSIADRRICKLAVPACDRSAVADMFCYATSFGRSKRQGGLSNLR